MYRISSVQANERPVLYILKDLLEDEVPGYYYKEELIKSEPLNKDKDNFFVEKVLKKKTVNREKLCLVKYLFYPNKFNQWVKCADLKIGQ